jgi:hypothetical protein
MKKTIKIILFLSLSLSCFSQQKGCSDFFSEIIHKDYKIKNDTIQFKAIFHSIGKVSQINVLKKIASDKSIKLDEYNTAISFTPFSYDCKLYLPYRDIDSLDFKKLVTIQGGNKIIFVTAVIFHKYKCIAKQPFFLINKIEFEE